MATLNKQSKDNPSSNYLRAVSFFHGMPSSSKLTSIKCPKIFFVVNQVKGQREMFRKMVLTLGEASIRIMGRRGGRRSESEVEEEGQQMEVVGRVEAQVNVMEGVQEEGEEMMERLRQENEELRRRLEELGGLKEEEEQVGQDEEPGDVEEPPEDKMEDEDDEQQLDGDEMKEEVEDQEDHEVEETLEEQHPPVALSRRPVALPPPPAFTGEAPYRYSNSTSSTARKFLRHRPDAARLPQREGDLWHCECGRSFPSQGKLTGHVDYFTREPRFFCPRCPIRFTSLAALRDHLATHHKLADYFPPGRRGCGDCGHVSATRDEHKAHRLANHPRWTERLKHLRHGVDTTAPDGILRCLCRREFNRLKYLSEHLQNYNSPAPFRCLHCPSTFAKHAGLRAHLRKAHQIQMEGRQYGCRVCASIFPSGKQLQTHLGKVHKVKRKFKCRECPAALGSKKEQQQHMHRIHGIITWNLKSATATGKVKAPSVPFKCPQCPVEFRINARLSLHMRRVHGLEDYKAYGCTACGGIFPSSVAFRRHRDEVHPELKVPRKKKVEKAE